jgi:hypothetical protein
VGVAVVGWYYFLCLEPAKSERPQNYLPASVVYVSVVSSLLLLVLVVVLGLVIQSVMDDVMRVLVMNVIC